MLGPVRAKHAQEAAVLRTARAEQARPLPGAAHGEQSPPLQQVGAELLVVVAVEEILEICYRGGAMLYVPEYLRMKASCLLAR